MERAAFITVIVAVILATAAFVLVRSRITPTPRTPTPYLRLVEPARITGVTISFPHGVSVTVTPEVGGLWTLAEGTERHVIRPEHVRALLGLLGELDNLPTQAQPAEHGNPTRVTIHEGDGPPKIVEVYSVALGGRVAAWVDGPGKGRWVLADAALTRVLRPEGVRAWRDPSLLWNAGAEPGEIIIDAEGRRIRLSRSGARWSVLEPVAAPADADACRALVARLAGMTVERFGTNVEAVASLPPRAVVEVRTPVRLADGEHTLVQTVRFVDAGPGRLVGAGAARWESAAGDAKPWGHRVFEIGAPDMAFLTARAGAYIARVASRVAPPDVGGLRIGEAGVERWRESFVRDVAGWAREGAAAPVAPADASQLNALVRLLCDTPASAATLEPPLERHPLARVAVSVGGLEAEVATLSLATMRLENGQARVLVIETGPVARVYPADAWSDLLDWLHARAAPEG